MMSKGHTNRIALQEAIVVWRVDASVGSEPVGRATHGSDIVPPRPRPSVRRGGGRP